MTIRHLILPDGTNYSIMRTMGMKSIRQLRGLTQEHLAEMAGVSQAAISRAEKLDDSVTMGMYKSIASALNVDVSELFIDDRKKDELALLEVFRRLSPDRQKGWMEMARIALGDPDKQGS
ncbi:helix-turn-helix transcriptional regulator [Thioclava sp. BHET1]|nr:helix-turn-helix transcriptional regulator [Thioclava sp. BHET1]